MLRLTCFALLVTFVLGLELQAHIGGQWKKFKSVHGKKYSGAEEQKRKAIFKKNVESILQHNLKADLGEETYTQGINEFSDMDHEEFLRTMTGAQRTVNHTGPVFMASKNFKAPRFLDWRQHHMVTAVKNQGGCLSCWAFCGIATVEGAWARKTGELLELSEQNVLDCKTPRYSCSQGGKPEMAVNYIIDNGGVNTKDCYGPYTSGNKQVGQCTYNPDCKNVQMRKHYEIQPGNENAMLEALATHGPISVAMDFSARGLQAYRNDIFESTACSQSLIDGTSTALHCLTIIGYGTQNGIDYWLLKNSYGETWGQKGYFKVRRNKNVCAIAMDARFPVA